MAIVAPNLWIPQGVAELEPGAWTALRENSRSVCVSAGAGAGKTEFLAQKATYLLQTGLCPSPKKILAISFKCDAAKALADRVKKRCPAMQARRFESMTFDAFTKGMLDRFRAAVPGPYTPPTNYQIYFPARQDFEEFLQSNGYHEINVDQLQTLIASTSLPFDATTGDELRAFWDFHFAGEVHLTFPMINRLVLFLIQENPQIRRALRATFPFVFLDEFQDTTFAQYEILKTAFDRQTNTFTAVGDDKQRIMEWAGAMPNAFDKFSQEFDSIRVPLVCNWRSHKDLVCVQHLIARQIDPVVAEPEARAERNVDGTVCAIWEYPTRQLEIHGLASWLAREIADGIPPHEIAILVRMRANSIESELNGELRARGIRLRNVARQVNAIAIQDLLGEEITNVMIPLFRLGASARNPEAWADSQKNIQMINGIYDDDEIGQRKVQQELERFVRELRNAMTSNDLDDASVTGVAEFAMRFAGESKLRTVFPNYQREVDFKRVWGGFLALLLECAAEAANWSEVLDRFEGIGQVPLMTIHKSKGLEFHSMVFLGLDNQSWWSLTPNRREELNSFFVAFTRAKQRAFFTTCRERGNAVGWIERLLQPAGVGRSPGPGL